jgi:hypothetical protein
MPHAVLRTSTPRCAHCGGVHPTTTGNAPSSLNPAERDAVANGWDLGLFRFAQLQLARTPPGGVSTGPIPTAPDQHARILAGFGATPAKPVGAAHGFTREMIDPGRTRAAAAGESIPPAPDPHDRIRLAAGRR